MDVAGEKHELKRELGLRDLAAMQVLLIVGVPWAGQAAKLGGVQVLFWAAAALLFFVPTAGVVSYCAALWPQEGGVYQWVRHTFGPFAGFITAWNFGVWALLTTSNIGILTATSLGYGLPQVAGKVNLDASLPWITVALFIAMLLLNLPGFAIGKWVGHFGTATLIGVSAILMLLVFWHPHTSAAHPHVSPQRPFTFGLPVLSLFTLNLFTKLAFNGFTGIEQVAVFAGETRNPARSILRSVWLAVPVIVLIYVLNTGSILTYVPMANVDLTGPLPQVLAAAFGNAGGGGGLDLGLLLGRAAILALAVGVFAQYVVILAETSRLPLVAGWDGIIPEWFTELHPRWRTPTRSIIVMCAVGLGAGLLATSGAGKQEAFQLLQTASNLSYGIYFLLMLAIPLAAGTRFGVLPGRWCRVGAVSGIVITVGAMALNMIPIVAVRSVPVFAAEVFGTFVIVNIVGGLVYWWGTRRGAGTRLSGHAPRSSALSDA